MKIPVPTTNRKFFRQSLEILKIIPPLNTLRARELDVLSEFLYWNYHYKHLPKDDRWKIIFDYETKLQMREYISIDEQQFNNCMTSLRKKNVMKKRAIENTYGINPETPSITFEFKLNE